MTKNGAVVGMAIFCGHVCYHLRAHRQCLSEEASREVGSGKITIITLTDRVQSRVVKTHDTTIRLMQCARGVGTCDMMSSI